MYSPLKDEGPEYPSPPRDNERQLCGFLGGEGRGGLYKIEE